LRYYDSANDGIIKGIIDLSDVESITQCGMSSSSLTPTLHSQTSTPSQMQQTKRISNDDKCYFELKTSKRVYYFCAKSPLEATKWKDNLETCLDS
jgi:myotubularin-related protein 5/13